MSLAIVVVLSLLEVCTSYTPAANPPMLTHASMDVGNIISIVIPESPDENINIEQLTGEFRQQLERIKKQSRASKVEHGLVTLKRVLPEMSREEKRKTLPLIRRVLHGRRVANSGSMRNWTRDASRMEQIREGGQFVRSRSASNPEERRIYRDYEESGNREAVTTRIDQSVADKDEYRRINERTYADRREEAPREDPIRRSDQIREEQLIHREEKDRREDRVIIPEDDSSLSKTARSGIPQEWINQNWEDQSRGDTQIHPETSTIDCNYKLDRAVSRKEPANEIIQNDRRYDKLARLPELRVNAPEEPNMDCTKLDQQMISRYPFSRQDGVDNMKRNLKDARAFELADIPGFVNYPREYDINEASNTDCDSMKRNSSVQSLKDHEGNRDVPFDKQHQEAMNFERESHRASQSFIQDPREQSDRSNMSGFENTVSENVDDYAVKKKRGHNYSGNFQRLSSIKSNPGNRMDRWNTPTYDARQSSNFSDNIKGSPNMYEIFGEKGINPELAYIQAEQGGFRANFDSELKTAASQQLPNYGSDGRILRIQRDTNETYYKNETLKLISNVTQRNTEDHGHRINESIFERLRRLFKFPPLPKVVYTSVIVMSANDSEGHNERSREAFTEAGKSKSTVSPSMVEPPSSTSHEVPEGTRSTTNLPEIQTTEELVIKPHTIIKF